MFQIQTRTFAFLNFLKAILNAKKIAREWSVYNNYRWYYASDFGFINRIKLQCKQWQHLNFLSRFYLFKWHIFNRLKTEVKNHKAVVYFCGGNGNTLYSYRWVVYAPHVLEQIEHREKGVKIKKFKYVWQDSFPKDLEVPY